MRIPYVDLAGAAQQIEEELVSAARDVIRSGHYVLGPAVERFEAEFAELCEVPHAIGVNSGTDALILSLQVLGIGEGDEVITVPNSFVSTVTALRLVGATPRFVDVGADYLMDVTQLEAALTQRTRALLPVHLTGRPAAMTQINQFAKRHGLAVIEDAAQAVCARYDGKPVGSLGTLGCFSLHPLKTLGGCGDGGMITTHDAALAQRLRRLRNLGKDGRDDCEEWSGNSRLDAMQAALLSVKLRRLKAWTEARRKNAARYTAVLSEYVEVPVDRAEEYSVYHTYIIQTDERDALKAHLAADGIGSAIHYPIPIHLQTAAAELGYSQGDFPVTERQARRILSLPIYPELGEEAQQVVLESIIQFTQTRESTLCAYPSPT